MKYTITPLNVFFVVFAMRAIYKYATAAHDDGLGATGLVTVIVFTIIGLLIDLAFQKFIGDYKWMMGVEAVITAVLLCWGISKGWFW